MTEARNGFAGGCQCGAVRYMVMLENLAAYACHCTQCRKQTSSAFAISVTVPAAAFDMHGQTAIFARPTDSGTTTYCHFCLACGTRVFHQSARSQEFVTLKGGTLDAMADIPLVAHLWASRKLGWVVLDETTEIFATQPDDLKAWRAHLVARLRPL